MEVVDTITSRERFRRACRCESLERPPVWIMRQAGRYLPEYRALKEKHTFVEMVRTPELAVDVTLQPLRRFALDAAILFSDILVIPEALGAPYRFREEGGIAMERFLDAPDRLQSLDPSGLEEKLAYTTQALRRLRVALQETAVLGFCGAPWTLAVYLLEGGSAAKGNDARAFAYNQPERFEALMQTLAGACGRYLRLQAEAGADALQIFDSFAGLCPASAYHELSLRWIAQVVAQVPPEVPVIVFAKGQGGNLGVLPASGAQVHGLDWTVDLRKAADQLPADCAVQGNLDPVLLQTTPERVRGATRALLNSMRGRPGHILNLGHGILPAGRIDCVEALVETAADFA
ncbi:MAG: uroporphyrinogen decarboxylase [Opitutales bacterium]